MLPLSLRRIVPLIVILVLVAGVTGIRAQEKAVVITIQCGSYCPTRVQPPTDPNAPPIQGLDPVATAYQKLHPNVTIQFITQPSYADQRRWLVTQLSGGIAPDIVWNQPDWAAEDYRKDWLVALDSYLEKPDPYVKAGQPGSQHWHDLFLPALDVWRAADNKLYMVLGDQVQVGIYYNKDLFTKAGITGIPKDWEELMQDAEKLKQAGFFPFAESANNLDQLTWVSGWMTNFFYYPMIAKYDTNKDGVLSKTEMATAVVNGTYSFHDEANKARLQEMKRFSTYWQPGALGVDITTAIRLFLSGRAGMVITGSWSYSLIKTDKERAFDFDVFYFPVMDSKSSKLIPDGIPPTNKAAGYGNFQYSVTKMAADRGVTDTAFDFLMFATAPENLSPIITEAGFALPAVKGAQSNPDLVKFAESVAYPAAPYQEDDSMFDFQFAQKFLAITSSYFGGTQSLDDTVAKLDTEVQAAAKRVLGS
jgi:raffinose/stachyose/melibiose transport system substrate-binding protein